MNENIYSDAFDERKYSWNKKGKKLASTCHLLSRWIIPVIWIIACIFLLCILFLREIITFTGALLTILSMYAVLEGILIFVNNLYVKTSKKLTYQERHDFLLYRYHHNFKKYVQRKNECLLDMAALDLETDKFKDAEYALKTVDHFHLKAEGIKFYDLLWIILELQVSSDKKSIKEWYIRYSGISLGNTALPSDDKVKEWIDTDTDKQTMLNTVLPVFLNKKVNVLSPLLFHFMLAHCIFYVMTDHCLRSGWHMRIAYQTISSCLCSLFTFILGIWILSLAIKVRRKNDHNIKKSKITFIFIGIIWSVLTIIISGTTLFIAMVETDGKETILKRNITDTGISYDFLKVDYMYQTVYYRSPDFMFMEEWQEASAYDEDKTKTYEEPESTMSPSSEPITETPEISSDNGFEGQNAMEKVYEYLQNSGQYEALSFSYDADAKGNAYALISTGNENNIPYELRLYDNGNNDGQREIVLEKVYPSGDKDTELIDFYLVNSSDGTVTDEQRTDW